MFVKARSRKVFDHCKVRAVTRLPDTLEPGAMICAKYPQGFKLNASTVEESSNRSTLALTLGCLACPYKSAQMPEGEPVTEAISRISQQQKIDELNRLAQGPTAHNEAS